MPLNTFEEPSSNVQFYRQFGKRVYCSHLSDIGHCKDNVIGQVNYYIGTHLYVYHYCENHKYIANQYVN